MVAAYKGPTHRFAWSGISVEVPTAWNLAEYKFEKRLSRVELEDDYEPRLIIEWTEKKAAISASEVEARFAKQSKPLAEKAKENKALEDLPRGWTARLYTLESRARIVVAYRISDNRRFFAMAQLYFPEQARESPQAMTRLVTESFQRHRDPVPWYFYDVGFELPADFKLAYTQLASGRKLLAFNRGMRKLYVWHFSLAHVVMGDRTPASFAAYFLNLHPPFRMLTWHDDGVRVRYRRRKYRYPIGDMDELGRLCHKYTAHVQLDEEADQLRVWAYNHRKWDDLADIPNDWLPPDLRADITADMPAKAKAKHAANERKAATKSEAKSSRRAKPDSEPKARDA